jgi:hypothetical protein
MTKNLTLTSDLFTPQYGFERGVIVEFEGLFDKHVQRVAGYFLGMAESDLFIEMATAREAIFNTFLVEIDTIKSITILTGPMRFWSGVPDGADVCLTWNDGDVTFFAQDRYEAFIVGMQDEYGDEYETEAPKYTLTRRPFWCDFGKGE